MSYRVGNKVRLKRDFGGFKEGDGGKVKQKFANGNYRVRVTHDSQCNDLEFPGTLRSAPETVLDRSDC